MYWNNVQKMAQYLVAIFSLSLVCACSNVRIQSQPQSDSAPLSAPFGLENLPNPIVKEEPLSRIGNRSPYMVNGRSYAVMSNPVTYRRKGLASWYGTKFHGRLTSNGEKYDMYKLTAAHKHLPLPSFVEVINLDNSKSTIVRVNDRGPFHDDRVIDLSYAAAVKLGFSESGIARVHIKLITESDSTDDVLTSGVEIKERFFLQLTGFEKLKEADAIARLLRGIEQIIYPPVVTRIGNQSGYQLRIGPLRTRNEAEKLQALAIMSDIPPFAIVQE